MQTPKTILLVDDDDVIATNHKAILVKEGYSVLTANTGEIAIQTALRESIDLVLMDIDLGTDIDGTEAARRILAKKEVPIVFLTSHSEKELVEKVKNITRYGYVIKNSGAFVLLSSIEMAFELFYTQRETRRKEELFELIANNTLDLIALHNIDGSYIYLSPSVERILGYKAEELIGENPYSLFHPEDIERIQKSSHEKVKVGEDGISISYRIKTKKGEYIWLETISKSIWDENRENIIMLQTVSRDITERINKEKRENMYEAKLKESQARYKSMVESSFEAIFVHRDYKFIYANAAGLKLVGAKSFQELEGRSIFEFVHPEYIGQVEDRVHTLYTEKEKAPIKEERFFRLDKTIIDVEISANPIEFDGEFSILVIARDITDKKNRERKMREAEYRFQTLIESLEVGVIVQDSNAKILISNPAAERLLGLTRDQLKGKSSFDKDWNLIQEDGSDFPGEAHPVKICMKTKRPVTDVVMGVYRPKQQDRVWLLVNAKPEFGDNEELTQVICTFQDITARKQNDEILKEKEERLRLALAAGSQGLYDLDLRTGKATVNHFYSQMLG
ncbi:MAG TPA: PAS domain S-box protein, partial [Leptospiraceae bacterium]|nr:PAS domain S-box protein [Leptospiraceae bacterium]